MLDEDLQERIDELKRELAKTEDRLEDTKNKLEDTYNENIQLKEFIKELKDKIIKVLYG